MYFSDRCAVRYEDHPQKDLVDLIGEVVFPNLSFDTKILDFGSILNHTKKEMTLTMKNVSSLPVNYHWVFLPPEESNALHDTKKAAKLPEGVQINQVFDILPINGRLEPNEQQVVTITYFGLENFVAEAVTSCVVEGGPEYEVLLKGEAARLEYNLDKYELNFGDILYDLIGEKEVYITNPGRVSAYFNFNLGQLQRPLTTDAHPLAGIIQPGEKQKVPEPGTKQVFLWRLSWDGFRGSYPEYSSVALLGHFPQGHPRVCAQSMSLTR